MAQLRQRLVEVSIPGPEGPLEGLLDRPATPPRGRCVVCHPHPLHGGAMTNKVVYTLATAALASGFVALRFNFRGVGASAGTHDYGRGEVQDVIAAVRWLREREGDLPLFLAGFSFGSQMALRAAATVHPRWLVTVGTPSSGYVPGAEPAPPGCPWLAIHGRDDEVVDCATTQAWLAGFHPPPRFEVVDGTGHFFHRHLGELRALVEPFLAEST